MTSEQFMGRIYDLLFEHLKTAGVSLFFALGVAVFFYIRTEKQDKSIDLIKASSDTLRTDLMDCMVNRARLEERVLALEEKNKLNNKKR